MQICLNNYINIESAGHAVIKGPVRSPVVIDAHSDSHSTDRILLRAGEGMDLPAAKSAFLKVCWTFGDEVNLLEDGTTKKNVDPWVQYLVPGRYPHPHYH